MKRDLESLRSAQISSLEQEGIMLAKQASLEGAVLLENNGVLPIKPQPVALYGTGARKTIFTGIGSGDVAYRYQVTVEQGLKNAGFTITSGDWLDQFDLLYEENWKRLVESLQEESDETGVDALHCYYNRPHILPMSQPITAENLEAASEADVAIYVITRKEGEGCDNRYCKGEYLPFDEELEQLRLLREKFQSLIILINTGSPIEFAPVLELKPDAVLLVYQGGAEMGNAVAELLTGAVTPSGKLTSTWARNYWDYPNSAEFGENDGNTETEIYREGVFIGYRYFDSFDVKPLYPFGYGMSYTSFAIQCTGVSHCGSRVSVSVQVKNVGDTAGKEVVQLYWSVPDPTGKHPRKELVAFEKTTLLQPKESQRIELVFCMEDFAVFSQEESIYYLEAGYYPLYLGSSSDQNEVCGMLQLKSRCVTRKVKHLFETPVSFTEITAPSGMSDNEKLELATGVPICVISADEIPTDGTVQYCDAYTNYFGSKMRPEEVNCGAGKNRFLEVPDNITLEQVKNGEYTLEELIASMDEDEIIHLCTGQEHIDPRFLIKSVSTHVPGACGETTNYFVQKGGERRIPYTVFSDGASGLRLIQHIQADPDGNISYINPLLSYEGGKFVSGETGYVDGYEDLYQYVTCLPIAAQLACTWNRDILYKLGRVIAKEMIKYDVDLLLAPGFNLNRNPLCGRNFEYYSEDPLVSAVIAGAFIEGVQSYKGRGAAVKHFAASNQEAARTAHCSVVTEKTMRELYMRAFELTIKYSHPAAVMTALNCVNGPHGTNNRDLAASVLRDEWNYKGLIMTDWNTTTPARGGRAVGCINAGDDLIMPGSSDDWEKLKTALHNQSGEGEAVTLGALQYCAMNVLRYILTTTRV